MSVLSFLGLLSASAVLAGPPNDWADSAAAPAAPGAMTQPGTSARPKIWDRSVRRTQAGAAPAATQPGVPAAPTTPAAPGLPRPPAAGAAAPRTPMTAPPTPAPTTPAAPPPSELARSTASALTGAEAATASLGSMEFNDTPIMLGDMAPFGFRTQLVPGLGPPPAPVPGQPPVPQSPFFANGRHTAAAVPWVRGFKMADNMSPRPQDRVFFTFNYFNDLNGSVNQHLGNFISNEQAYRYMFGFEKTFWDGNASIGIRMPIDNLSVRSTIPGFTGTSTAVGNLTVFSKFVLWQNQQTGSLISTGLAVTTPNGPTNFAGSPAAIGFRDAQIQPFVGYIFRKDRWFVQGFEAIDVPTDKNDVTAIYNDVGIGYFLYQSQNQNRWLTGIVPIFETHVNVPVNHVGALRVSDPAGTPNVVDLTLGTNFIFGRSAILTLGFVNPVTGPKPFDFEWTALLNVFFGRTKRMPQPMPNVPVIGS